MYYTSKELGVLWCVNYCAWIIKRVKCLKLQRQRYFSLLLVDIFCHCSCNFPAIFLGWIKTQQFLGWVSSFLYIFQKPHNRVQFCCESYPGTSQLPVYSQRHDLSWALRSNASFWFFPMPTMEARKVELNIKKAINVNIGCHWQATTPAHHWTFSIMIVYELQLVPFQRRDMKKSNLGNQDYCLNCFLTQLVQLCPLLVQLCPLKQT